MLTAGQNGISDYPTGRENSVAIIDVRSELAGSVWKVEAVPGTNLEEDDTIVILESMKMEIPVAAPKAGKLIEILVKEGDTVSDEQVIARIEA